MKNQRVHILTSWYCTNDCVFCMDDKSSRSFIEESRLITNLKEWLKYSREVTFTSWEPTIHPLIIEFISIAKRLWYSKIQIVSNWRKYKDYNFVEELIKAWLNDFIISLHWDNSNLHDRIVRKNWAFNDTIAWMINVVKAKKKFKDIILNTNTTITGQNYKFILNIVKLLEKFPIDSLVLNAVIPQWEALKIENSTLIKYSFIAEELKKLLPIQGKFKNIYINWIPPCLSKDLNSIIGYRENVTFREDGENIIRESKEKKNSNDIQCKIHKLKSEKWKMQTMHRKQKLWMNLGKIHWYLLMGRI